MAFFVVGLSRPVCKNHSSLSLNAIYCEFEPGHREQFHLGRNRRGAWRSWTGGFSEHVYQWVNSKHCWRRYEQDDRVPGRLAQRYVLPRDNAWG